ncbi:MAG: hypothetical protein FRX49_08852 [Trebouxia sp. A1-2]|nr:MAG: hypothetical protein FRX49_08852 [Trebouxia sp. A1-2]
MVWASNDSLVSQENINDTLKTMWPVPTIFMPRLDTVKNVLALRLLATVPHKLHSPVVLRPTGSLKGFWNTSAPARVLVVAGNEGIAMSYNAGGGSIVDICNASRYIAEAFELLKTDLRMGLIEQLVDVV